MSLIMRWMVGGALCLCASLPVAAAMTAEEILLNADEVRSPQLDYTLVVTVADGKPNKAARVSTYEVLVKGKDRTIIKTLSPPMDRGRVLLMQGRNLWAFMPTISKPLRVSLQERLTGEVANGDLARANFSGDYTPTLLRTEPCGSATCDVLDLTAVADDVTYGRVTLWVEQATFHPQRAEFYALSGRLLKTCGYARYQELAGRLRPTQLVMQDALVAGRSSTITIDQMTVEPLPDKYFTKDYLKRLIE